MKNVKLDYIYCFFKNLDFSSAIWVLYFAHKGMSLVQIGILEGIFHLSSMIFEVPSGAAADLFGRKKTMILGRICYVISCFGMLISTEFTGFAISFVMSALSYNFNSGSEEALVYDSMKSEGKESYYMSVNGKLNMIIEVSQTIATVTGGILAEYSYTLCYTAAVVVALLALVPALFFQEKGSERAKRVSAKKHFTNSFHILRENKEVRSILLYFEMVFAFFTVLFFYAQKYFSDFGMNQAQIGLIMLVAGIVSCMGAAVSGKLVEVLGSKVKYLMSIIIAICIIGMGIGNLGQSIVLFMLSNGANAVLYPVQSYSLNRNIPSAQRATILSVGSMLFSVMMVVIFPMVGLFGDRIGLKKTFLGLGILQFCIVGLAKWNQKGDNQ